jgi:TRAP transporter TAXI family solute receptor
VRDSPWLPLRYLPFISILILSVAIAAVIAAVLYPAVPRVLVMATGPVGSANSEFGRRYQEILARKGVRLTLMNTAGAITNLSLLGNRQSGADIAFVENGLVPPEPHRDLVSLGTVAFEPVWIFGRDKRLAFSDQLNELRGKRISIGPVGGGTQDLARQLLARNGINDSNSELLSLSPEAAAAQLAQGSIDVAIILTSVDAPAVQQLLGSPDITLISLKRADAYIAIYPFLSKLILPAGAIDLANNRPPADVELLATKTSLVVRRDLQPAIQYLLLAAATEIHSPPELFHKAGEFPAAEAIDWPLSEDARQFYKSGMPFLQHYLPLWLAVLAERAAILLIPLAAVVYPLLRALPALYGWGVRQRIYRLYGELKVLELKLADENNKQRSEALLAELSQLEGRVARLRVPVSFAEMVYDLRRNTDLVRTRLGRG